MRHGNPRDVRSPKKFEIDRERKIGKIICECKRDQSRVLARGAYGVPFGSLPSPSGSVASVGVGRQTAQAVTACRGRWVSARWAVVVGVGVVEKITGPKATK